MTDRLIRDSDVAKMLGISKSTLWRRVKDGVVPPPVKIGASTRWVLSEIEAVIDAAKSSRGTE